MVISDENVAEYFLLAQAETLTEREQSLLSARYGMVSGQPQTLEQIGRQYNLSRERIRQLLQRAFRKLRSKGKRDIKHGRDETASALLSRYLEMRAEQQEETQKETLINLASLAWPHLPQETGALPLLVNLLFDEERAKQALADLLRYVAGETPDAKTHVQNERKRELFQSLCKDVLWPRNVQTGLEGFHVLSARLPFRQQRQDAQQEMPPFQSEKMQRKVVHRSLLERKMLELLEATDEVVFYQEQPWLMTEIVQGKQITCTPDMFIALKDGRSVLVEVTHWQYMALASNWTKYNALRQLCLRQGWGLLITDGTRTLQEIKRHPIPQPFQTALLEALAHAETGSLSWKEYQQVREAFPCTWQDLVALILTHRLHWSLEPFSLTRE